MDNTNTLDFLLSHRKTQNDDTNDKFKNILKTHILIKNIKSLEPGDIICHMSYKSSKLSPPGIITNIIKTTNNKNEIIIKKIKLMNTYLGLFWELNVLTKKYHLFSSIGVNPYDAILLEEIEKYINKTT